MELAADPRCQELCRELGPLSAFPPALDAALARRVAAELVPAAPAAVAGLLRAHAGRLVRTAFPLMPNVVSGAQLAEFDPQPPVAAAPPETRYVLLLGGAGTLLVPRARLKRRQLLALALGPALAPAAYEQAGHIAHYNGFAPAQLPYRHFVGLATLSASVRTVVMKLGRLDGRFRAMRFELLAGAPEYEVRVRQHGFTYRLDYSAVYWNSRLADEHARVAARAARHGGFVLDGTCGVGPFALPLGRAGAPVLAADLNPRCVAYLRANLAANGVPGAPLRARCRPAGGGAKSGREGGLSGPGGGGDAKKFQ